MDRKRQNNQMKLAFGPERRGEAPAARRKGTEPSKAKSEIESPGSTEQLMEEVVERENLRKALKRVKKNKGSPGIDGMTVEELPEYLKKQWPQIKQQILDGTYKPQAVKRVWIPKATGGQRPLGIPTVTDRFVQQAVLQVFDPIWDRTFSEYSYGFRPGKGPRKAVRKAQEHIVSGRRVVVDMDLEKFFDRVHHDRLMSRIAKRVKDRRMLKVLRAFLNAGVMENGLVKATREGTPQGGPLSPLLSNIVLDELDQELERRGQSFVRYADDFQIYVQTKKAGRRVMYNLTRFIEKKLRLKVNARKSAVDWSWKRKFLGFSFTNHKEAPKRRIAKEALRRFKKRIREITRRNGGQSAEMVIRRLKPYILGWRGYFGDCQTPSVLEKLDSWIRRRLRSLSWKQWRTGKQRYENLRRRGLTKDLAAITAANGGTYGYWKMSAHPGVNTAFPSAFFKGLGLPPLLVPKTT